MWPAVPPGAPSVGRRKVLDIRLALRRDFPDAGMSIAFFNNMRVDARYGENTVQCPESNLPPDG